MGIPVFFIMTIFIVFVIQSSVSRSNRSEKKEAEDYMARERESNMTPRKDLSTLNFITIPGDIASKSGDFSEEILACEDELSDLSNRKIVNLTGISNTDLKLSYGTANLPLLSEYDACYTKLARTLNKYGRLLYDAGYLDKSICVLEFAVSTGTDVSESYVNLAKLYRRTGRINDIDTLAEKATALNSLTAPSLISKLEAIKNEPF